MQFSVHEGLHWVRNTWGRLWNLMSGCNVSNAGYYINPRSLKFGAYESPGEASSLSIEQRWVFLTKNYFRIYNMTKNIFHFTLFWFSVWVLLNMFFIFFSALSLSLYPEVEKDRNRTWCPKAGCETVCLVDAGASSTSPVPTSRSVTFQLPHTASGAGCSALPPPCLVHCPTCREDFCSGCKKAVSHMPHTLFFL